MLLLHVKIFVKTDEYTLKVLSEDSENYSEKTKQLLQECYFKSRISNGF